MPNQSNSDVEVSVMGPVAVRHSNSNHVTFKTTSVIEQFKTKVSRRRSSKQETIETILRPKLRRTDSIDLGNDNDDSVVPNRKTSDGSLPQVIETKNESTLRSKPKPIQSAKSLPVMENPPNFPNNKKRRQTLRRTVRISLKLFVKRTSNL